MLNNLVFIDILLNKRREVNEFELRIDIVDNNLCLGYLEL